ncbi:hypothetical protein F5X68DRAFT_187703 [Plectosphaerella plurivora]|uniref:Carrier domain-containing protein n=1 Tax=Plectosphaerella plurivora TaxID=936078 RepID=A0A9P8VLF4_9PEZI|nr:hypothetical protein F5X68DRAFT_187703 [Plectosphaerella plurivora]
MSSISSIPSISSSVALQDDIDIISSWYWNGSSYTPPVIDALIHEQIKKQVEEQPDAEAVCAWDGSLTYKELDHLASALSEYLHDNANIGHGTTIPLCFEKSKLNVVSMLAILKAGCACVPMDPAVPIERMQTIFELLDNRFAYVVLASSAAARRLSAFDCQVKNIDVNFLEISQAFFDKVDKEYFAKGHRQAGYPRQETNTAALVVFTSGSTGTPKGIVQEHRGYCSAAAYHGAALGYGKDSRIFQFAAHTFDVSLCDILTTLIHGGCICIPSDEERMNDVAGAINRLKANHLPLTPTVALMIRPEDVLPGVKFVTLGGEALSREGMNIWADRVNLIQAYGPAEAGVDCTVRQNVKATDSPNNLGKAIGSSIWIVDSEDHNKLVPIGTEGELLIEGPIVARCYLGNSDLTARSFIEDPDWVKLTKVTSGRRFYKTGDLGYFTFDGEIQILGRNDSQVKLRGQRLEIGEVEHHLRVSVGDKAQVAVAAVTPKGGAKILAAFIAMNEGDSDEEQDGLLADWPAQLEVFSKTVMTAQAVLKDNLPSYMIPSAYIPVRKIPISPSGKIERKLLCSLAEGLTARDFANFVGQVETNVEKVAPSTHQEEVLFDAWKDSLYVEDFGVEDDFFHLGGDSAKAMILVASLRKLGFALTVADIIRNPVLKDQAKQLKKKIDLEKVVPFSLVAGTEEERNAIRDHVAEVCRMESNWVLDAYPITEMQERFFHGSYLGEPRNGWVRKAREEHKHTRQMVFKITGDLNVDRFSKAWAAVSDRHNILRTRFVQKKDSQEIVQVVIDYPFVLDHCDCLLEDYLWRDRRVKMTWGKPLLRVAADEKRAWIVVSISHAIYNGFSLDLVFKDLKRDHFMKYLGDGDQEATLAFWRNHFSGAEVTPVVPHDRLDVKTTQNVCKRKTVALDGALPAGSPNRSAIIQVTAALFLAHGLECADIIFDTHLSGRTGPLPGIEGLVGPTLTSLPIRIHIGRDDNVPVRKILEETQRFMNTVVEHEHIGWWKLVQMDEFRDLLRGAPLLNVLPGPDTTGRDLGLHPITTIAFNETLYGVMATLVDDNTIELLVCGDKECVPEEIVVRDLMLWEAALQMVWASCVAGGDEGVTVGAIFSRLNQLCELDGRALV